MSFPRAARPRPRIATGAILVALVLVAGSVTATSATEPLTRAPSTRALAYEPEGAPATPPSAIVPTIHYQDATAHARDRISFKPGGRVDLGFSPRAGDSWQVDGEMPRALPAGNATGTSMARSIQGSTWAAGAVAGKSTAAAATPTTRVPAAPAPAAPTPAGRGLLRQVFGFLPYWELADSSTTLNYDVLSTIAYFSVGSDPRGNLLKRNPDGSTTTGWGGWTSQRLTDIIAAAHRKRTRVVLTITMFAWTTGQRAKQAALLGSPAARLNLARQTAAAIRDRGADGVNLDFEPIASGYEDEFTALVRTVRSQLNAIAPGYQLTFDTTGYIGNYPIEAATALGAADAIFIMGYDYRTAGTSTVGSIAPLGGPRYDVTDTVRAYAARVPASKLILGVPYYGRAWSTSTSRLNARNISGPRYGHSTAVVYANAMPLLREHGRRWDPREKVAWTVYRRETCSASGCVTAWRQVYVDDVTALRAKYDTVLRYRLRGAGIWALGYDDQRPELNQVLAQKFLHDTAGPTAGIRALVLAQREEAFRVTWSAYDISGVRSHDVQVSRDGGPWTNWLLGTTRTSELFIGFHGHGYAFRTRARDAKGNVGAWNVTNVWDPSPRLAVGGFARVEVDGLAMRSGASTAATKVGEFLAYQRLLIVGGPVAADGYTWWRVIGPLTEWRPVDPLAEPVWVAQGPSSAPFIIASRAPNTASVDAYLRDLSFGDVGRLSLGPAGAAYRAFSPNADGSRDSLRLRWTNGVGLAGAELRVLRTDGTLVGARTLTGTAAGAHVYDFDGAVDGARVPDGRYMLAVVGTLGPNAYGTPSTSVSPPIVVSTSTR